MLFQPDADLPQTYRVRVARLQDIEALIELRSILLDDGIGIYASGSPEESTLWKRHYRTWLESTLESSDQARVAVAVNEIGNIVGCAIGIIDQRAPAPGAYNGLSGWIQTVVVDPINRKQGVGAAIIQYLHEWFRNQGLSKWVLQTTPHAEMLYQRLGYRDTGERTLYRLEEPRT